MTLLLISFGLAMDCTAVSAAYALSGLRWVDVAKLAVAFGSFQAGMALLGALGGNVIATRFGSWDAWIAFLLLLAVGLHMIYEALFEGDEHDEASALNLSAILALAVATSIDALAVGATLPALDLPVALSVAAIGSVSFGMSFAGAWAGLKVGDRLGPAVEVLGGIVLIAIGIRALVTE